MLLDLYIQFRIILYSILAGVIIGFNYDFYKLIRGKNISLIIKIIQDILFSIFSAICIFLFLLYNDYGFFGVYVYIAIAITFGLYMMLLSPYVYTLEIKIYKFILTFIRILCKLVIYPIKIMLNKIRKK